MSPELKKYEPIAEAIATLFHPYVEVIIHDTRKNCAAAVFNPFSKRKPGDPSYLENLDGLAKGPDVHGPFEKKSFYGKRIKYTSAVIRDKKKKVIGLLCINLDVHVFTQIQSALEMFLRTEDSMELDELFDDDWQGRINTFVHDYLKEKGLALSRLSKTDRIELVRVLQTAGAFRAKNAANYIANVIGVSRATIYNYLSQIDEEDGQWRG